MVYGKWENKMFSFNCFNKTKIMYCKCLNLSKFSRPLSSSVFRLEKFVNSGNKIYIKDIRYSTFFTNTQYRKPNNCRSVNVSNYSTQITKVLEEICTKNESLDETNEKKTVSREDIFQELSEGDPNVMKQLKIIEFEIEVLREQRGNIPNIIKKKHWIELLKHKTIGNRKKYLDYLFLNEKKTENLKAKKERLYVKNIQAIQKMIDEGHLLYKMGENAMFLRIYEKTLSKMQAERLLGAKMFSQTVVFDCSYEAYMNRINSNYCGNQLALSYALNRVHPAPFNVVLCNVNKEDPTIKRFARIQEQALSEDFPWDIREESYLDLFPKERIVYLTPHTKNELHEFSQEDVYIIGAFVDKGTGVQASLAKAKNAKVRMAKLPLDFYLNWEKGMKSLALNIMLKILLDQRLYNNWAISLKNVPSRFLKPSKKKLRNQHRYDETE